MPLSDLASALVTFNFFIVRITYDSFVAMKVRKTQKSYFSLPYLDNLYILNKAMIFFI